MDQPVATLPADPPQPARVVSQHPGKCMPAPIASRIELKFQHLQPGTRTIGLRGVQGDASFPQNPQLASPDFGQSPQPTETPEFKTPPLITRLTRDFASPASPGRAPLPPAPTPYLFSGSSTHGGVA